MISGDRFNVLHDSRADKRQLMLITEQLADESTGAEERQFGATLGASTQVKSISQHLESSES